MRATIELVAMCVAGVVVAIPILALYLMVALLCSPFGWMGMFLFWLMFVRQA